MLKILWKFRRKGRKSGFFPSKSQNLLTFLYQFDRNLPYLAFRSAFWLIEICWDFQWIFYKNLEFSVVPPVRAKKWWMKKGVSHWQFTASEVHWPISARRGIEPPETRRFQHLRVRVGLRTHDSPRTSRITLTLRFSSILFQISEFSHEKSRNSTFSPKIAQISPILTKIRTSAFQPILTRLC